MNAIVITINEWYAENCYWDENVLRAEKVVLVNYYGNSHGEEHLEYWHKRHFFLRREIVFYAEVGEGADEECSYTDYS